MLPIWFNHVSIARVNFCDDLFFRISIPVHIKISCLNACFIYLFARMKIEFDFEKPGVLSVRPLEMRVQGSLVLCSGGIPSIQALIHFPRRLRRSGNSDSRDEVTQTLWVHGRQP